DLRVLNVDLVFRASSFELRLYQRVALNAGLESVAVVLRVGRVIAPAIVKVVSARQELMALQRKADVGLALVGPPGPVPQASVAHVVEVTHAPPSPCTASARSAVGAESAHPHPSIDSGPRRARLCAGERSRSCRLAGARRSQPRRSS